MRTILVVEDERVVAKDLQQTLVSLGYLVPVTAASADEAIRSASERCPDLVLMDIRIKGDRDGIETAQILRRDFDVPVVYLSASSDDETLDRVKMSVPYGYLIKPVSSLELRSAVEIAIHKHQIERRLREREHWFSTTLRSIGDAVIATDPTGNITFMNGVAELLTGQRLEHVMGQRLPDVLRLVHERTGDPVENPVIKALRDGTMPGASQPTTVETGTGKRTINETTTPIVDDAGKTFGAVLVCRDVTEHRQEQQQLVLSDRLSSLATMAAGVAHEVNNPLTVVVANAAIAQQELAEFQRDVLGRTVTDADLTHRLAEIHSMLTDIRHSADRVAKVIADLRTFSQVHDGSSVPVDVRHAVEWAVRITDSQVRQHGRLVRDLEPVPNVIGAEIRIGQVFVNLIVNAVHALRGGSRETNEIRIATRYQDEQVVITVTDNGAGMTPEVRKRIFEPFFTTREVGGGAGLGLSVSHGIVRSLGGGIAVDSELGKGTTFKVMLPPAARPTPVEPGMSTDRARIVLIDDEPVLLHSLERVLAREHEVLAFTNPTAALETILGRDDLDLVICDLIMPGLSGMEIYARILQRSPALAARMVFVTGGAFTPSVRAFLDSITNPCLEKPFGPDRLRALVRDFLANRARPAAVALTSAS
ncbi:MAG: response regulator [Deltaproteobacteria bacterium]|nr:response regulator [Deltaproteobacteria bacterium]